MEASDPCYKVLDATYCNRNFWLNGEFPVNFKMKNFHLVIASFHFNWEWWNERSGSREMPVFQSHEIPEIFKYFTLPHYYIWRANGCFNIWYIKHKKLWKWEGKKQYKNLWNFHNYCREKDKTGCSKNQVTGFKIVTDRKDKTKFTFLWETIKEPEVEWYSAESEKKKILGAMLLGQFLFRWSIATDNGRLLDILRSINQLRNTLPRAERFIVQSSYDDITGQI